MRNACTPHLRRHDHASEQSGDFSILVHVDLFGSGDLGKTRHGHDVTREGYDEPGAGADLQVPHGDGEALGRTQQSGIVGQGILGLCHAHRQIAEAQIKELLGLLLGGGVRTACAPP